MAGLVAHGPALCATSRRAAAVHWEDVVATVHLQMRSLVGPTPDLEDLTQAALEQTVKSVDRYEGRAELSTYTYRICAHVALNHFRSWRRWLRRFTWSTAPEHDGAALADEHSSAPEQLIEVERSRRLHAALERLSPMRRVVVTLADLEELPASRIAEILDCPEATVRSRLRKARQELYEALRRDRLFEKEPT